MSDLTKLYDELNRLHLRGRLPSYRVRRARLKRVLGYCSDERRLIVVQSDQRGPALRRLLLHEMCHVGSSGHGRRFQRKLRRLARRGEGQMLAECAEYDGSTIPKNIPTISLREAVWSDLESLALEHPRMQWRRVRRILNHYELAPAALRRLERWAEAKWRELSRDYRAASPSTR
jgi:hypothetical protein